MTDAITVGNDGSVILSSEFLTQFPEATARVESGKLLLENVCREKFHNQEFVSNIHHDGDSIFWDDGILYNLVVFSGEIKKDVLLGCDALKILKHDGTATGTPTDASNELYDVTRGIDYRTMLQDYLDATVTLEQLVWNIGVLLELSCNKPLTENGEDILKTFFGGLSNTDIQNFINNTEAMPLEGVLQYISSVLADGTMGSGAKNFTQNTVSGQYEISSDNGDITHIKCDDALTQVVIDEISQTITSIDINTLRGCLSELDVSTTSIDTITTDFGASFKVSANSIVATVEDDACGVRTGEALYDVLKKFRKVNFTLKPNNGNYAMNFVNDSASRFRITKWQEVIISSMIKAETLDDTIVNDEGIFAGSRFSIKYALFDEDIEPSRGLLSRITQRIDLWMLGNWYFENRDVISVIIRKNFDGTVLLSSTEIDIRGWDTAYFHLSDYLNDEAILAYPFVTSPKIPNAGTFSGVWNVYYHGYRSDDTLGATVEDVAKGFNSFYTVDSNIDGRQWKFLNNMSLTFDVASEWSGNLLENKNVLQYPDGVIPITTWNNNEGFLALSPNSLINGHIIPNTTVLPDAFGDIARSAIAQGEIVLESDRIRESDLILMNKVLGYLSDIINNNLFPTTAVNEMSDELIDANRLSRAKEVITNFVPKILSILSGVEFTYSIGGFLSVSVNKDGYTVHKGYQHANWYPYGELNLLGVYENLRAEDATKFKYEIDGYMLRIVKRHLDTNQFYRVNYDLRFNDLGSGASVSTFDPIDTIPFGTGASTPPEPPKDIDGMKVIYTPTANPDGSVTVSYQALDTDGNDITDQFNTLTLGETFLHKEIN